MEVSISRPTIKASYLAIISAFYLHLERHLSYDSFKRFDGNPYSRVGRCTGTIKI